MTFHRHPGEGRDPAPAVELDPGLSRGDVKGVGRLLGIARHDRPRGPMEVLESAAIGLDTGVEGDYRGALKPGRNKRQITAMAASSWAAAMAELGADVPWQERRVNLLLDGLVLEDTTGARLHFANGVVFEITGWCDPCKKMEWVTPGLEAALMPGWRSGINTRVIVPGAIAVGEEVRMEA